MCLLSGWSQGGGGLLTDYVGNVLEIMWSRGATAKSGSRDYGGPQVNLGAKIKDRVEKSQTGEIRELGLLTSQLVVQGLD